MALLDILRDQFGADFHPGILLAKVVADEEADLRLRVDCAKTLLPYTEASLKSVEIRGSLDSNIGLLRVSMFQDQDDFEAIEGQYEEIEMD